MPRRYNIKWRKSDEQELKRAVRNYNDKIRRLEKKAPEYKSALPERVSVREIKELISTRQDLKRELNSLKRFSVKGAEEIIDAPDNDYNLKITKWQKKEMVRRAAVINRRRTKRLKEIEEVEMTSGGEKLGYTKGQFGMGKAEEVALKPIKPFNPSMSRADLKKKYRQMLKESQADFYNAKEERMKKNYIQGLLENYRENDISEIVKKIENMDFKDFYSKFQGEVGTFEFAYPPNEEEYEGYLSKLKSTWIPQK